MDLEITIPSKVSQKEKDKYHISLHVESKKMIQMNLFPNRNRLTDIDNKCTVTKVCFG